MGKNLVSGGVMQLSNDTSKNSTSPPYLVKNERSLMLEKCVLTILELNWNQRLGHKKTNLNICHHMLTSSTQLQNSSFHVVERTRTSSKFQKLKKARAKRAKILLFIVKYAKFVGLLLP